MREPTKLNLRGGANKPKETEGGAKVIQWPMAEKTRSENSSALKSSSPPNIEVLEPASEAPRRAEALSAPKNLNCLFMYNGHDWDAYQVLGVAAGSPLPIVTQAYQDLIKKSNSSSYEFFEAAYKAILKSSQGYRL